MKEITMFMFDGCPFCARAFHAMDELKKLHPEYATIPIKTIDENLHPEIADTYDYYYVPTFYVDGKKVHEGRPVTLDAIEAVFKAALEA